MLRLQMTCASQSGDDAAMRNALEQLVGSTGKAEYWSRLLRLAERAKGLSDHQTLDIYRIKFLTGSITGADEYEKKGADQLNESPLTKCSVCHTIPIPDGKGELIILTGSGTGSA